MRKTLMGTGIAVIATAALVAGCGDDATPGMQHDTSSSSAAAPGQQAGHNEQDIAFAQDMIQHHGQALEMAKLVPSRSAEAKVLDLASRIQKAQDPEIQQMQGWLTAWGAATSTSTAPGTGHGSPSTGIDHGGSMPGMMTEQEMQQLAQATGGQFDRMWLEMMIRHHQGAIEMARTELDKGASTEAKDLGQKIIDAQQAEIDEMQELLKSS